MAMLARIVRVLTAPFVRYEVRGGACVPDLHVGVVAVNHRSLFDVAAGLVGLHQVRRYPRLLIAEKYVAGWWTAPFARAIGAIPVPRGGGSDAVIRSGVQALREGKPLLVMPEGRLHHDPSDPLALGQPRTGVSRLAVGADTIVLTAGLSGTEAIWPATSKLPRLNPFRPKRVIIRVADEPLRFDGDDHQANAEAVMASIRGLLALDLEEPRSVA